MSDKETDKLNVESAENPVHKSRTLSSPLSPKKIPKIKLDSALKKDLFIIACIGEVMIVMILLFFMVLTDLNAKPLDVSLDQWSSDYIEYRANSWYADETLVPTEETVTLLSGPGIDMAKGSYIVTIDYESTSEQGAYAPVNTFIQSGLARLMPQANKATFELNIKDKIGGFTIVVKYDGHGALKIKNITIKENHGRLGRMLVYLLILFVCLDAWFIYEDKIRKNKTVLLSLFGIVILTSLPLFTGGIGKGHDLYYHAMRIEALADSLKNGIFPNRLSTIWFDGYGYPSSIYYGDILLYIPALMRIIGFPVVTSYKIYVLGINIGTAVFGYLSFKCMFKNKFSSLLAVLVYSTATYRLVNIYIRAALGEYTAMMFFPIIVCGIYKIYTGDMIKKREYFIASSVLAAGMTGLIGCHILSTEMVCLFLAIVCIILLRKTFKLTTLRALGIAVAETVLMTAYFVVPFLDYYKNVNVNINNIVEEPLFIQWQGCSVAEYFGVFRDVFTQYTVHANERLAATPGFILLTSLIVGVVVLIYGKKDDRRSALTLYMIMSVFSLYIASDVFPWDSLALNSSFGRLLSQVQFPWRYVALAVLFCTLVFAWLFDKFQEKDFGTRTRYVQLAAVAGVILFSMVTAMVFDGAYVDDMRFKDWVDAGDLDPWAVGAGEYKLNDFSDNLSSEVNYHNMQTVRIVERSRKQLKLYCESKDVIGSVEVPIFNYKGYEVTDDKGNKYDIQNGKNSTIKFLLEPGFEGEITVAFREPWYWKLSEIISLISVLGMCGIYAVMIRKEKRNVQ